MNKLYNYTINHLFSLPEPKLNTNFVKVLNTIYSVHKVLLITQPFTQLNTPYPATAYIKGFLNTKSIASFQMDLGIEVILSLFSKNGLEQLFSLASTNSMSANAERIFQLKKDYIHSIDSVIRFLQGHNPTVARLICQRNDLLCIEMSLHNCHRA